jgi:hypothetical protein
MMPETKLCLTMAMQPKTGVVKGRNNRATLIRVKRARR